MFWKRKPLITEDVYGKLMTSFGRVVDSDPFVREPAAALAERVILEEPGLVSEIDLKLYRGAVAYHLRLLAGSWILVHEGSLPANTAAVFEEAVAWKFHDVKGSGSLPKRLGVLARGEGERDLSPAE